MNNTKTVFVGLSGGVDSSVAAARLLAEGFDVVGVFIKVWHPEFMVCNWEQERLDAMRVAAHLDIPFLTCDAESEYRDDVAKYFIDEYKSGRTPNPDVMCNQHVKFGAFLRYAQKKGADYIATGHYVQRIDSDKNFEMHRGVDKNKDQSYFLWTLSKEQLEYSLFPVGDTPKNEIRREAELAGIPVASKKDSQGICFLGHVDIADFLSHYIDLIPGSVLNLKNEVIGIHKGALVYTNGQRHGFEINEKSTVRKPYFVIGRDIKKNTITVSNEEGITESTDEVELSRVIIRQNITTGDKLEAQFRYRQKPFEVEVLRLDGSVLTIQPIKPQEEPASGQSCVLYKNSLCFGGGIIS